jgi:ubiquitin carboxyl-terminal hydrolase L3
VLINVPVVASYVFISNVDGHLYELDGRKDFPINHGESSADNLLEDACAVIQQFMDRSPGELRFTIVALASSVAPEAQEE